MKIARKTNQNQGSALKCLLLLAAQTHSSAAFSSQLDRRLHRASHFPYYPINSFAHKDWLSNKVNINRRSSLYVSTQGTDVTSQLGSIKTKDDLRKLTVKQLRELLKTLNPPVKTSHLKLKADLIDFLFDHIQKLQHNSKISSLHETENAFEENLISSSSKPETNKPLHRGKIRRMPNYSPTQELPNTKEMDPLTPSYQNDIPISKNFKDLIFEEIMERYPPLKSLQSILEEPVESLPTPLHAHIQLSGSKALTGLGELDIRHMYHPMLKNLTSSDLDVVTVGTSSCVPGVTRGVSCTALRLQWRRNNPRDQRVTSDSSKKENIMSTHGTWIFDCGESTQLQIQRTGSIRPGKITKIFITHSHGDHSFGLPGLLCIMGQDRDRDSPPIDIYGPEGLRMWLRSCIRYSVSRIVPPYRVHELMDIPMAPEWTQGKWKNGRYFNQMGRKLQQGKAWEMQGLAGEDPVSWITRAPTLNLDKNSQFGEIPGGRDIYPIYDHPKCAHGAPVWEVENEGEIKVYAAPMSHGVPCVGYVVEEAGKPGRLRSDLIEPIAKRNLKGLSEAGMRVPMKVMGLIKDLPVGGSFTFPDGTVVHQKDVVDPPRKGRKVVICGDTCSSRALEGLAQDADLLIHEATNTYLTGIDKDTSSEEITLDTKLHGHSTPAMAGIFAKRIKAKRLLLNHFSSRYRGDQSLESMSIMTRIERQAIKSSGLPEDRVGAAWDLMILPVPSN